MIECLSGKTPDGKVPGSNLINVLNQTLVPNLVVKLPMTFESNKIKRSD